MPIVVLTVFAILYLSFYLHDLSRIRGMVNGTLHKAGLILKHKAEMETGEIDYEYIRKQGIFDLQQKNRRESEQSIQEYLEQKLSKGLFIARVDNIKAVVESRRLTISVETKVHLSIPWIRKWMASSLVIHGEYPIHDPAETIRVCEVILDTASMIKGMDELKSKIEGFFSKEPTN